MKFIKKILKWIGILLGVYLLFGICMIAWGFYREPIALQQAKDFCASIVIGQPAEGLPEKALAADAVRTFAKWHPYADGVRSMNVTFIGMPPFSRHMCSIKATDVVISAEYSYLD